MRIGILEAETLPAAVTKRFGSYGDMFVNLLQGIDARFSFQRYAADQEQLPASSHECDAYLITGSRHNAYDSDPWIESLKAFIRQLDREARKCAGICFGHQVIAQALGGKVEKSERGWGAGLARFARCSTPSWMSDAPDSFNILVSHQDQVVQLPSQAELFATSDFCPNGGYFVANHIFCLQGHPEFSKHYVQFLIDKREEQIGAARCVEAINSLQNAIDQALFQKWLSQFLLP